ncbi:MAG: CpsB/CapC family capsule biosynthesis tyrosine phosphatase [Armatimonadota bacterium]|nr:CpsB/CapC family capsule biosynthesis tyrosine phosphatase [Armatimonadota bacterium]
MDGTDLPIEGAIDIHNHILPGFDDGPETMDEAVLMARLAAADGVGAMFATPHIGTHNDLSVAAEIPERVAALQAAIDTDDIPIRIFPGAEVYPSANVTRAVDCAVPLTLGGSGRYLLLDTPMMTLPVDISRLVFDLQTRNITPILAHPERSLAVQRRPGILEELTLRGALIQVNAASILGYNGRAARIAVFKLLRQRWVHFMASDAHSARRRRPALSAGAAAVKNEFGPEKVSELTKGNGSRVITGDPVPSDALAYRPGGVVAWLGVRFLGS